MATHYEILGVDHDASHDELKRAYLDLALRYHPDRLGEVDPAVREQAVWRMTEINDAWYVLQSPGRRARYDDELAEQRRRRDEARRGVSTGSFDDVADLPVAPGAGRAPQSSPVRRTRGGLRPFLPVIVLGVILTIVLIATAYAGPAGDDEGVDVETVEGFAPGTCVQVYSDGTADAVPCDGPSTGRVVSTVSELLSCPPGAVMVPMRGPESLCLEETP